MQYMLSAAFDEKTHKHSHRLVKEILNVDIISYTNAKRLVPYNIKSQKFTTILYMKFSEG